MLRKILRVLSFLCYLGILGLVFGLVSYVAFSQFVRSGVTKTPDVAGLSEVDATALLADQGLKSQWSEQEDRYDETVPSGHILLQIPRAGTLVKRGSAVRMTLSRGPQMIVAPDVTGTALQAAQVTLGAAGLTVGRTVSLYGGRAGSGVMAQRPAAGERMENAATVDLFLSLGDSNEVYLMPDLVYRPSEGVRRFFERNGFSIGRVSYDRYGYPPGTILDHFPKAGYPLRRGDVISLRVQADDLVVEPVAAAPDAERINDAAADSAATDSAAADNGAADSAATDSAATDSAAADNGAEP